MQEKKITVGELLIWFKRYERFVQGDAIDAEEWRGEFLEFVMYLINNLDEEENETFIKNIICPCCKKKIEVFL